MDERKYNMRTIIIAVFFFVVTGNAFSDQIPLKYQGYWSGKSCKFSIEQYALFVGSNGYIYEDDTQVEFNFVFPKNVENWTASKRVITIQTSTTFIK